MISLSKARQLKSAGLRWRWEHGDFFVIGYEQENPEVRVCTRGGYSGDYHGDEEEDVWFPRLDQLLAEIEGRGYMVWLKRKRNVWTIRLRKQGQGWGRPFIADVGEDAAADALIWILEQEEDGDGN